jgi:hypothetical protein
MLKKQMTVNKTRLRWTDEDIRRLRLFVGANASVDTIAKSLGRTRASVKLKAYWLNLSPRSERVAILPEFSQPDRCAAFEFPSMPSAARARRTGGSVHAVAKKENST